MTSREQTMSDAVHAWSSPGTGDAGRTGVAVIHGFTGNPHATRPLGEDLAANGWRVEVPRLPGHGTTVKDMAGTRYEDWRGEVMRVARQLRTDCDTVVLVGHSMGGTLALDITSSLPTLVDGVVSINAQILDPDQPLAKVAPLLQWISPPVPRALAGLPANDIKRSGPQELAYDRVPAKAAQSLIRNLPRVRAQLPTITVPALVAWSTVDHTVAPQNSATIAATLSGDVQTLELQDSYHVAMLDNDAELLTQRIADFIRSVEHRPATPGT